jgi:putative ABC transport system permease protein
MTPLRYIADSLWHHRRTHFAVALGVAVATAIFTGALVIGDSLRGSLRDLTLQRLGQIDFALVTPHLFRSDLASELTQQSGFEEYFHAAEPILLLQGSASAQLKGDTNRAANVAIAGVLPRFWSLSGESAGGSPLLVGALVDETWITEPLAKELGVQPGDEVVIRLPTFEALPADSPLGERAERSFGLRVAVGRVLPTIGLARFSLDPTQRDPRTAFLDIRTLQKALDHPGKANAILVGNADVARPGSEEAAQWLRDSLQPKLADYGLKLDQVGDGTLQIESDQLVLPDVVVQSAEKAFGDHLQFVSTYLANTIRHGDRKIPYSTITGVESTKELGPLLDEDGNPIELADDEIALNRWAADDLEAKVGDTIEVTYYEPESTHGELREAKPLSLKLAAIVELKAPDGNPTKAADPRLTPRLEGVTDQKSINDWDLPFELVERVRREDEDYWDEYSTTPKAFVSFDLAKRLWKTRWGSVSLIRIPEADILTVDAATKKLQVAIDPTALGFTFQPVKAQGLAASSGTTPFDLLFLGFSMFLIASAVMLIALLFRLGLDARAKEVGLLGAIGWSHEKTRRVFTIEALIVAAVGAMLGVAGGIAYSALMLWGLQTLWLDAIVTPFLTLHVRSLTLVFGILGGLFVAWLTIRRTLKQVIRQPSRALLAGVSLERPATSRAAGSRWSKSALALAAIAVACGLWGAQQRGESQAGAFFGSGALLLAAALVQVNALLKRPSTGANPTASLALAGLALRNVARRPGRSTLTIGLVAAASFLILAISAFRLAPTAEGTGGYEYVATSATPIHYDLNTPAGRVELGFTSAAERALANYDVQSLRVFGGEDASCLNLYRPQQPRVLGVPQSMNGRVGFAWATSAEREGARPENPWTLLDQPLGDDANGKPIVPVVLDMNTAIYSLRLYGGVGSQFTIRDEQDQLVTLQVVGLLKNSMLQGDLLVGERDFLRIFPNTSGSQFWLLAERDDASNGDVAKILENQLSDYGFAVESTRERLANFLAVQNTYLSTFQSLGALGLLLGTVGLAVVQLRNMLERRGELALMQAAGFAVSRLGVMILLENLLLLGGGLAVGAIAAGIALLPQTLLQDTTVPLLASVLLLAVIFVVGILAGRLATAQILRRPLLATLRGE